MGIFDRIASGRGPRKVADEYLRTENSMIPRWARPPERNTAEWIKTFSTSPRLAVVNRIASDLSFASGKLYAVDNNGEEKEITAHPFLDLWDNLNPLHEYSSAALWQLHEIYLLLKGEAYFVIERDDNGRPTELWPVPTHWVFTTPYLGFPFYRIRTSSGALLEIPVEDMFIMKTLNPLDPFMRGLGEAESVSDEVETDEYASKFQKRFFYNDATPNLVISMPGSSDEQRKRFRADWLEKFRGIFNSHSVATVDGNAIFNKIGDSMKDMDMVNGRIYLRDAVLEHFGVPREIMGITENSNRATAEAAQFIYAQNVLTPRLQRREDAVNKQLLPAFGDNLIWRYDEIIPRNQEFDKARAIEGWNAGLLLKDEARDLLDHPAATKGKIYKGTFSDVYIGENQDPVEATNALAEMEYEAPGAMPDNNVEIEDTEADDIVEIVDAYGRKSARKINLTAAQRSEDNATREMGAAFEVATLKYFREQSRRIMSALGENEKADARTPWSVFAAFIRDDGEPDVAAWLGLDNAKREEVTHNFISGLIDWTSETKTLSKIYDPLWRKAYDTGAAHAQKLYGVHSIKRPELVSTAKLKGGARVQEIAQTTKDKIGQIVADGITNGDSTRTIAEAIKNETEIESKSRAKLIARQEVSTSLTTGQYDMMKAAGATTKTWHSRPQKNPRDGKNGTPNHVAMNGETVTIDGVFSNGLRFPKDPEYSGSDSAEQCINCHCYITYGGF